MELHQIEEQIKALETQRQEILKKQRSAALEETRKNVQTFKFTAAELGLGAVEESVKKPRRSKEERQADEKAKHEKTLAEARAAFAQNIQVRKFANAETGVNKYYFEGKKGVVPAGEGVVVGSIEEIV